MLVLAIFTISSNNIALIKSAAYIWEQESPTGQEQVATKPEREN